MVTRWGEPPWRIDEIGCPPPLPSRCGVAVIGGGLTGLSAAYHLARAGARPAVLEAGRIGSGASGRTGAIVLEGTALGALDGVTDCLGFLESLVERESIACGLELSGCWELEHRSPSHAGARLWRDGDSDLVIADSVPGGTVDAGALVSGLARAALRAGATIHESTRVVRIELSSPPRLHLESGVLSAERVVLALNAYTPLLLPLGERIRCALTLAASTTPLDPATIDEIGLARRRPFYTTDLPYLWGHCRLDGRLLLGAGLRFGAADELEGVNIGAEDPRGALDRLETRARGFHPALATVCFARRWAGPIAIPIGRPPYLGRHPDVPAVIVTGAYGGHGVALSVRVGALAAGAISEGSALPEWGAL